MQKNNLTTLAITKIEIFSGCSTHYKIFLLINEKEERIYLQDSGQYNNAKWANNRQYETIDDNRYPTDFRAPVSYDEINANIQLMMKNTLEVLSKKNFTQITETAVQDVFKEYLDNLSKEQSSWVDKTKTIQQDKMQL